MLQLMCFLLYLPATCFASVVQGWHDVKDFASFSYWQSFVQCFLTSVNPLVMSRNILTTRIAVKFINLTWYWTIWIWFLPYKLECNFRCCCSTVFLYDMQGGEVDALLFSSLDSFSSVRSVMSSRECFLVIHSNSELKTIFLMPTKEFKSVSKSQY